MRVFRTLSGDDRGVAIVEFAILFPAMVLLLFGAISATNLARASMKVWNAAQSVADLVSQEASLTTSDMTDFCKGGALILAPSSGALTFTAASVTTSAAGATAADWQDTTCNGAAMSNAVALGTPYVPNAKDSVIVVKATYAYSFPPSYVLPSSLTLTRYAYARPRAGTTVPHS